MLRNHVRRGKSVLDSQFITTRERAKHTFVFLGSFIPYKANPSVGSHCGAEWNSVADAIRRRRRISLALLYLIGDMDET